MVIKKGKGSVFRGYLCRLLSAMAIAAAMIVTLYLGGWQFPYIDQFGFPAEVTIVIQILSFFVKTVAVLFFFIWIRWSIPRFRYDQLMNLGWKVMFPLSIINILWVAALIMIFKI